MRNVMALSLILTASLLTAKTQAEDTSTFKACTNRPIQMSIPEAEQVYPYVLAQMDTGIELLKASQDHLKSLQNCATNFTESNCSQFTEFLNHSMPKSLLKYRLSLALAQGILYPWDNIMQKWDFNVMANPSLPFARQLFSSWKVGTSVQPDPLNKFEIAKAKNLFFEVWEQTAKEANLPKTWEGALDSSEKLKDLFFYNSTADFRRKIRINLKKFQQSHLANARALAITNRLLLFLKKPVSNMNSLLTDLKFATQKMIEINEATVQSLNQQRDDLANQYAKFLDLKSMAKKTWDIEISGIDGNDSMQIMSFVRMKKLADVTLLKHPEMCEVATNLYQLSDPGESPATVALDFIFTIAGLIFLPEITLVAIAGGTVLNAVELTNEIEQNFMIWQSTLDDKSNYLSSQDDLKSLSDKVDGLILDLL